MPMTSGDVPGPLKQGRKASLPQPKDAKPAPKPKGGKSK